MPGISTLSQVPADMNNGLSAGAQRDEGDRRSPYLSPRFSRLKAEFHKRLHPNATQTCSCGDEHETLYQRYRQSNTLVTAQHCYS